MLFVNFQSQADAIGTNVVAFETGEPLLPDQFSPHGFTAQYLLFGSYEIPNGTAEELILPLAEKMAFRLIHKDDLPGSIDFVIGDRRVRKKIP